MPTWSATRSIICRLRSGGLLFIENVGNLVCPAAFDLGEAHKVVVLSVTEGEDKPLKYPDMFAAADLMLLNKADLLPHLDFDVSACLAAALRVNPRMRSLTVSARTGEGLAAFYSWIEERASVDGGSRRHEFASSRRAPSQIVALEIRVRGRVQGVGFRPMVWRIARDLGLSGEILNDADGVLVRVGGSERSVAAFIDRMEREPPPLGRIDRIETRAFCGNLPHQFRIAESVRGTHTQIAPDAAICDACVDGNYKSVRAPFPLPIHQLYALRAAPEHRQRHSL